MVNLERTCILLFYYFLCLKVNPDLEKAYQLGESSPDFIFGVVNLDPIILEKGWIDGESWPKDFVGKVNQRWRLEVGRFKISFDACIKSSVCYLVLEKYFQNKNCESFLSVHEWAHDLYQKCHKRDPNVTPKCHKRDQTKYYIKRNPDDRISYEVYGIVCKYIVRHLCIAQYKIP